MMPLKKKLTSNMQMEQKNIFNKKTMVLIFAGPNGSGKSTITEFFETIGTYTKAAQQVDEKRYLSINKKEDFTF